MKISKFQIKNFRSLKNVEISLNDGIPNVITGENNIGKTNFLRAMDIYFNHIKNIDIYDPKTDIPHHIYHGSRGSRATEFIGTFIDEVNNQKNEVLVHFNTNGKRSYKVNNQKVEQSEVLKYLSEFHFFLIQSHNIHLPTLISTILEKDGLLALDSKRSKQSEPLKKLQEFIELSRKAIDDIQKEINLCFKELTDFDGFLSDSQILINFAEFEKLRDVVKTMTSITLHDGNNHPIESKGSGAQRAVFLSLMKYISKSIKNKQVIWGIDEPEAFLQPRLQHKVFDALRGMCKDENQIIILTTHSQHFIDLGNINSINLFIGNSELKEYKRRPGIKFHEIDTQNTSYPSSSEKINAIKNHLGIKNNDGWELLPFNILVEGEEDKRYLEKLMQAINLEVPNIIYAGGASKIAGYLQYYNDFAKDSPFDTKPKIICIFDNDSEGRKEIPKIKSEKLPYLDITSIIIPNYNGNTVDKSNLSKQNINWEIEDFIPTELIIEAANNLLRKDKYKTLNKSQINTRNQNAHLNKIILQYLSECTTHNNPDKDDYFWDSSGRKMTLCKAFCNFELDKIRVHLTDSQINFLKNLTE